MEIGPGPGGLTRALLCTDAASVTVIEIDQRAVDAIRDLSPQFGGRLRVVHGDALALDPAALVPEPRQIIANLPYNIATPLLITWLKQAKAFERLTLMFQQEVAERICAEPDATGYGRLSVLAQWICQVALLLRIPPTAFVPAPKVYSAVVGLTPHSMQPSPALFATMERVTAAAFGQRRKMLRRSLKSIGGETLLRAARIAPDRRAETLNVVEFDQLARLVLASETGDESPKPELA